ncbi:LysR family transcriptional regulator [Fusibacter ferrireducens]|uniref:LysR family transcriptional regulator n=1 Tax=Fusibacter ferrireducens TaxID=2785058 RepID=A0ABR9ZX67_9FIRM|nr:LysR family transcriptional regulator [Fusibacter ferrireducens]MBF4695050.1 LysR family transcriptional regulator [Fusibacter ferrireducens]
MKMLQLCYFKALAENEHLTNTAKALYISPPALSAVVARLEEEIGVPLFDRVGRNIKLNENGKIFYKCVDSVLSTLENTCLELKKNNSEDKNSVNVAVSALTLWTDSMASFFYIHPEINISHAALKLDKLQDANYNNQFDFIITDLRDLPRNEWEHIVIIPDDRPVLVVNPEHPFAQKKHISLIEAKDEPFVALTKGYSSRRYFDEMFELAGFKPKIVSESDYPLRSQMIEKGYGITISTITGIQAAILKGFSFIEIDSPANVRTQTIFWKKGRKLSNAALIFRDYMIDYHKEHNILYPNNI